MNETNTEQNQKPKTSKLATASIVCLLVHFGIIFLGILLPQISKNLPDWFLVIIILVISGILLAALILGYVALWRINRSNGLLKGKGRAKTSVVISSILILAAFIMPQCGRAKPLEPRYECKTNVNMLGVAIMSYAYSSNGNGHITMEAEKWCDFLITRVNIEPNFFKCRASDAIRGESSYTLNKNVAGITLDEIPNDVVLIFESEPGWNQVGGPELLTTKHHQGEGCNILFADGHSEFVKTEALGTLRWEP
ncbi:MAG: DUF4190 domain-containing protein [Planctomycetota bacterium]|jgi:prepilin-type processing-associated H-X9-DG protein